MTDKIEFPIGVELPLRGGGVAVLYEAYQGRIFGRWRSRTGDVWTAGEWCESGQSFMPCNDGMDILPPKRKAWVVWDLGGVRDVFTCPATAAKYIETFNDPSGMRIQEITEP